MKTSRAAKLTAILDDSSTGEREVHDHLKKNLEIVINAFATSWNFAKAYAEVEFGSEYRADFVVLCADSGSWTAHVVELKSPKARLYTTKGVKSRELLLVERQLAQRLDWRQAFDSTFRESLAKRVSRDSIAQCSHADSHSRARAELRDPRTVIWFQAHAVIGRSSTLSAEERELRRQDELQGSWGSPRVLTFDRLIHCARRLDGAAAHEA